LRWCDFAARRVPKQRKFLLCFICVLWQKATIERATLELTHTYRFPVLLPVPGAFLPGYPDLRQPFSDAVRFLPWNGPIVAYAADYRWGCRPYLWNPGPAGLCRQQRGDGFLLGPNVLGIGSRDYGNYCMVRTRPPARKLCDSA